MKLTSPALTLALLPAILTSPLAHAPALAIKDRVSKTITIKGRMVY